MGGLAFFIKGAILGFSIAAPVGPIGILCIRRTLDGGLLQGFLSGMGAATADGFYGCLAAFGVTAISSLLLEQEAIIRGIGGLFLLYLGFSTLRAVPAGPGERESRRGLLWAYVSVFFPHDHEPDDNLFLRCSFCGVGCRCSPGQFEPGWMDGAGGRDRLRSLVAYAEQHGQPVPIPVRSGAAEVGQPCFGLYHR